MAIADITLTATADGSGSATLRLTPYRRQVWTVSQVSVEAATAPTVATAVMRKNGYLITPLVAQGDAAGGDPPVTLRPGELLTVDWDSLNPGDQVRAVVIYDDGT